MHLLEEIRTKEKISKTEMASRLGIAKSYYSMITSGKMSISKNVALKIHNVFGIPLEDILCPSVHENKTSEDYEEGAV